MRGQTLVSDLSRFAHLGIIYDEAFRKRYCLEHQEVRDLLWTVLCDPEPVADPYRREFDVLVEEGLTSGSLDDEMRGRLRSRSAEQRYGALSELEVAHFFSVQGFSWFPRPHSRGARRGDIQIDTGQAIFVEVKALLNRPEQVVEEYVTRKLWRIKQRCLERLNRPLLVKTRVEELALDFDGGHYRRWLLRLLQSDEALPLRGQYVSRSGLVVKMEIVDSPLASRKPAQIQTARPRFLRTESYVHHSLDKAYEQLPDDGRICLIVLRPHLMFNPGTDDMLNSLYRKEQWIISLDPKPRLVGQKRAPDGFFSRDVRTRVSAVGLLSAVRTETGTELSLHVYHNPFARYPLDWKNLAGPATRHFVPGDDGTMVWVETPHD